MSPIFAEWWLTQQKPVAPKPTLTLAQRVMRAEMAYLEECESYGEPSFPYEDEIRQAYRVHVNGVVRGGYEHDGRPIWVADNDMLDRAAGSLNL